MKALIYSLAGAAVVFALAAGPVAAQGRERPAGGGGATQGGSGGVRTGGSGAMGGGGGGGMAVPRGSAGGSSGGSSSGGSGSTYTPPTSGHSSGGAVWRSNPANGGSSYVREMYGSPEDRSVPRGARPNPGGRVVGGAIARPGMPQNGHGSVGGSINWAYNPWWLYSGWGLYGLGYAYYAPDWWGYGMWPWGFDGYGYYGGYGYGGYGYGGYNYGGGYGYYDEGRGGQGGLKLKVEPNSAEVYVDGYYMGIVDDFDGTFQRMDLEVGAHRVEIRAPGYQTIAFEVRIELNDTITYRGELQAIAKR